MAVKFKRLLTLLALVTVAAITFFLYTADAETPVPATRPHSPARAEIAPAEIAPIAKTIHQTYKTATATDWAKEAGKNNRTNWFLSWEGFGYSHSVLDDVSAAAFISSHFDTRTVAAYSKMPLPVLKADLLRYAMLYIHGGVYSDSDTECLQPVDNWYGEYPDAKFIASVEWYKDSHPFDFAMYKKTQLVQWTFAAGAKHPILKNTIAEIVDKVESQSLRFLGDKSNVESIGGPQVFTRHIFDYMAAFGEDLEQLSKKDDDKGRQYFEKSKVLILPMFAFMAQLAPVKRETAFVNHHFAGTYLDNGWKNGPNVQK
ncbi:hypothetical protein BDR26DRAFT_863335 [Obelidium mucronatum]|nr:hypothetical protein BDR26DRAFT_863335 [Obelidium mucronatum]